MVYRHQMNILLDMHVKFPLQAGTYAVRTEIWNAPRKPFIGETGTQFKKFVAEHGTLINSYKREMEIGL